MSAQGEPRTFKKKKEKRKSSDLEILQYSKMQK